MTVHPSQVERVVLGVKPPGWQIRNAQMHAYVSEHGRHHGRPNQWAMHVRLHISCLLHMTSALSLKEKAKLL